MRPTLLYALFLLVLPVAVVAAPVFDDYPATIYSGRAKKVRLGDAKSRQYATVLRAAARGTPPNFAGHYVLASWGCGASCTLSAAIDAKTGAVAWLPFTVCCWEPSVSEPLEFRRDSHLLIVHGSRDEQGGGVHYYDFNGEQFFEVPAP